VRSSLVPLLAPLLQVTVAMSAPRLRFDDSLCAYVCRVIDADGLEYCTRLQRRALELDRTCAIRGQFPDSGWQTWWLHLHPLTGDVTKELSKLFDGLPDVSTGGGPLPGAIMFCCDAKHANRL
jgi:hypothetical protein